MELTRKQIYDMMWTEGVGKTEKALGLKQVELKALCDKLDIPRPSSGYWPHTSPSTVLLPTASCC